VIEAVLSNFVGGAHFEPNTLLDHCDWVFDHYFQKYKMDLGLEACDWNGVAELVCIPFSLYLFNDQVPPETHPREYYRGISHKNYETTSERPVVDPIALMASLHPTAIICENPTVSTASNLLEWLSSGN
jgi:hypothetical protein